MAADTTLAGVQSLPAEHYKASVGETWQEFTLPYEMTNFRDVRVYSSGAFYAATDSSGVEDGGTPAGTESPGTATTWFRLGPWPRDASKRSRSFFLAAQSGTINVNIWLVAED